MFVCNNFGEMEHNILLVLRAFDDVCADLSMNLPEEDPGGLSLVFEVRPRSGLLIVRGLRAYPEKYLCLLRPTVDTKILRSLIPRACTFSLRAVFVAQVWHSGTLANALVGSTRRVTMTEIEPPSPAAAAAAAAAAAEAEEETEEDEERDGGATPATVLRDSDSNTLWLDLDSGGKLMVSVRVTKWSSSGR